ncbi:X-ray repair cross-complementing protein 5-like protein [Leptotrombidium deliense]|uniref:X-ray repair cross-complementing protein 5-like protein n=1 Tax=Leptotrombidium deliense TaxID=299467 RepID=A0A443SFS1_9ACAR|nr:X-ray repair cross-complementing protein 5-like protein [Leptotrombidium deliense]
MPPRSKNREAVALILDIGKSMQKMSLNSSSTIFQEAKLCLIKILEQKIFSESPNEYVLILFGSDETKNGLKQSGSSRYSNIFVYENLRRPSFELLQYVENITPTENEANIADAIVVGADVLHTQTVGQQCDLIVLEKTEIGSKFADELATLELCKQVISSEEKCLIYSLEEAKNALAYVEVHRVDSAGWYANIYFGSKFVIPIVGYIKTTQNKLKSWQKYKKADVNKDSSADIKKEALESEQESSSEVSSTRVLSKTRHFTADDSKDEVDEEDIIHGYAYGSTIVPLTKEDEEAIKYQSERKGFEILFFTSKQNVKVHYNCGDKTMIVAVSHKAKDARSTATFIALARALYETDCVAIVRYCRLERYASHVGYLAPIIDAEKVVFTYIQLPFADDLRYYNFPVFNKAKKDVPSEEQLSLVDDLISCMDLTKAAIDDDGFQCEAFVCEETHDPNIQNKFKFILKQYLKTVETEADIFELTDMYFVEKEEILLKMKEAFPLEIVETKRSLSPSLQEVSSVDNKKVKVEEVADNDDVDIEISTSDPKKSFEEHVESGHSWITSCTKLEEVILKLSANLMGFNDKKILDSLEAYRKHSISKQNTKSYNAFLLSLKDKLKGRSLWKSILQRKLSLITELESQKSGVSLEDANEFAKN